MTRSSAYLLILLSHSDSHSWWCVMEDNDAEQCIVADTAES